MREREIGTYLHNIKRIVEKNYSTFNIVSKLYFIISHFRVLRSKALFDSPACSLKISKISKIRLVNQSEAY